MLRAALFRSRPLAASAVGARHQLQWLVAQRAVPQLSGQRCFADKKRMDETVVPGSQSAIVPDDIPPPPTLTTPANPSEAAPPPLQPPRVPPSPEEVGAIEPPSDTSAPSYSAPTSTTASTPISTPASTLTSPSPSTPTPPPPSTPLPPTGHGTASVAPPVGPPPPPPAPKRKPRRFRRFLLSLILLSGLGYGGGVYYSLINDNFHDFFTEYVPFGEDAVGYFEERAYQRRFAGAPPNQRLHEQVRGENKVKIPGKSGMTPRLAQNDSNRAGHQVSDLSRKGPHVSAIENNESKDMALTRPEKTTGPEQAKAVDQAKAQADEKPAGTEAAKGSRTPTAVADKSQSSTHDLLPKDAVKPEAGKSVPAAGPTPPPAPSSAPAPAPEPANQAPPKPAAAPLIDNLDVPAAQEPAVQDVVKILNDIITVINADNASGKYSSAIEKARGDLSKVIDDIKIIKATEQKVADDKIKALHSEFDNAAKELMRRFESQMHDQESRWKDEYEAEREKLARTYDNKLKAELDAAQKVYDQKLKNELLEQAIELQRDFTSSVRNRVETERSGRLSKLDELEKAVNELEKLTSQWNAVVDANLQTQHLLVAVEAVRAALESADRPKPFVTELAALKEVAAGDAVVNAAIASISPSAYQSGIPTAAQLVDRFRHVAKEVRKAALLPENAGVASHAASLILSKVMFKKGTEAGLPVGNDVESVLGRTEMLLEEGNLDQAAREMNQLTGWAKVLARDWLAECRRVLEVKQALDVITTESRLRSLLVD